MGSNHLSATGAVSPDVITTIAERTRSWFRSADVSKNGRIEDLPTLQALGRLEEHRLKDIGVYRKPRHTKWETIARGMAPVPIVEFDYFRLDN